MNSCGYVKTGAKAAADYTSKQVQPKQCICEQQQAHTCGLDNQEEAGYRAPAACNDCCKLSSLGAAKTFAEVTPAPPYKDLQQ